ncbi:MAG: helix-turn-helix domain-containing protein [Alphaproteobacteria bacterium]|nr:helix-turn-helix domain-containing protein [Alphaproteobacteria bacterium]MBO6629602.1 helix-turn-helix domain-containing protein [Alphaproteobacteria bacterium]
MTERAIESLSRGLAVIEALNRRAYTTLSELHDDTGLPKSTLVRLLDTLIAAGYARRISRTAGYCLTDRVTLLADGFQSSDRIVEVARPHLKKLTEDHKWPVVIATLDGDAMLARYSTLSQSPFALDRIYIGRRIGLLVSAMGRAVLAYSTPETRALLLAALRGTGMKMDQLAHDTAYVDQLLETIRRTGYALTDLTPQDRAFGIAVPVMKHGEPQAALAMRFIRTATTPAVAGAEFAPILREAAAQIAEAL